MVEIKELLKNEDITQLFGLESIFYTEVIKYLKQKRLSLKNNYDKTLSHWVPTFKEIYGKDDSLNSDLFLKHTYFALILKSFLTIKLGLAKKQDFDNVYEDFISNNLSDIDLFEFNHFFYWVDLNKDLFKSIFNILEFSNFAFQDLFLDIYQQIFFPETRHKLGEFYTPAILVEKMVNDVYNNQFSLKVLDPSCGSGNFLISLLKIIIKSERPENIKLEAINRIYGFDINPLATLTAKVNILLLLLDHTNLGRDKLPNINIYLINSLFTSQYENNIVLNITNLYSSFDLIIGNPPWLTYKDLNNKDYQDKIRDLAGELGIKPLSQYITHIELASLFFYACTKFLKPMGKTFFVLPKSVLNGDHCFKFRGFRWFNNVEIWDFPNNYFFNVNHICLKADFIGKDSNESIESKYPIKTKIFDDKLELQDETYYSSVKIEKDGAKIILPMEQLEMLNTLENSQYKKGFFQGATLVPRTLVFFQVDGDIDSDISISTDPDIYSRAKKEWKFQFQNKEIEKNFCFKTFLNKDLIPFHLKILRNVFLPLDGEYQLDIDYLKKYPKALNFYNEMNQIYQKNKKITSNIETLFSNLNYWNKLTKQFGNKKYLIVYNASGSKLKAAVIENIENKTIIGSENYYFSTDSKAEAYYLSAILNSPSLSNNIKLIKSSRHIHKRPFSFPIPIYDENNELHNRLAKIAMECEAIVHDLLLKDPNINAEKVKTKIHQKLQILDDVVESIIFKTKK